MVLTHSDLNEMNILVDPCSGKIIGVVDWPGASIQPFGFTFYAPENALGSMGSNGWKCFDNVDHLRSAFWRAFREQTGLVGASDETELTCRKGRYPDTLRHRLRQRLLGNDRSPRPERRGF